jgi:hypothetical protein
VRILNGTRSFPIDVLNIGSYVDQLKCIFEYLGSPSDEIVKRIARGKVSIKLNLTTTQLIVIPRPANMSVACQFIGQSP